MAAPYGAWYNGKLVELSHIEFAPNVPENVAGAVRTMVQFGADPSVIHKEIEEIIAARDEKERITKTLKGVADLAKMAENKPRRIVLASYRNGETGVSHGLVFPNGKVFLQPDTHMSLPISVAGTSESLEKLKASLDSSNTKYHIEFID